MIHIGYRVLNRCCYFLVYSLFCLSFLVIHGFHCVDFGRKLGHPNLAANYASVGSKPSLEKKLVAIGDSLFGAHCIIFQVSRRKYLYELKTRRHDTSWRLLDVMTNGTTASNLVLMNNQRSRCHQFTAFQQILLCHSNSRQAA
jgi:hypothetical protein